jgi:predicted TIM-barrel fold metal-dependent hydrolase
LNAHLDEMGASKAVQMTLDWGLAWGEEPEWDVRAVNRFALEIAAKHPGKIYAACGIDPRRRDAAVIAAEIIKQGAVAIKLMPAAGFSPDDPICYPVYEVARDTGTPIVIHTGTGDIASNVEPVHPYRVEKPAKLFPKLQFVLAHAGGDMDGLWREVIMLCNFIPNIAVDLAEWQYVIQPTELDNGREGEFIWTLNTLRRNLGPHNIMWATDFIKGHRTDNDKFWAELFLDLPARAKKVGVNISEEEAEAMRAGNAIRIFGLHD